MQRKLDESKYFVVKERITSFTGYRIITRVMTPMRSISLAGLLGVSFGVECPLGGDELASDDAVTEAVMDVPGWTLAKFRPSKLTLATLFSISSARNSVDSFSS